MRKQLTVGGVTVMLGCLLTALPQARAAADPAPEPEAPVEVVQAVNQAMGDSADPVPATVAAAPPPDETSFGSLTVRVAGVLVFTLVLLYLSLRGMKRFVTKERAVEGGQIQVLGRTSLSPKASVYLLRFGDHYLVVGEAGERLTALASLPARDTVEIEEETFPERAAAEPAGAFGASLDSQQAEMASQDAIRHIAEGVKKLRQETQKLLKVQNGGSERFPDMVLPPSGRKGGRARPVGAQAP